jgi:hypothetical protein
LDVEVGVIKWIKQGFENLKIFEKKIGVLSLATRSRE